VDISVKITKENKDGSANAIVRFDKEGLECLVQWGLIAMLTKALDEYKVRPEEDELPVFPLEKAKRKKQVKK